MNTIAGLTPQQLRKAADLQERIAGLQSELAAILDGREARPATARRGGKRNMSQAGRAAISAAAKARWQKYRAGAGTKGGGTKRTMSAAAKARLSALAKARWEKAKKAGKSKL